MEKLNQVFEAVTALTLSPGMLLLISQVLSWVAVGIEKAVRRRR